ncbi:MAG: iron-sulfur cluster repair di-iron protein [Bacillota bacterium]|jgi:regulator of cell morphogenesis and NO signaling
MEHVFQTNDQIGTIVSTLPKAALVFERHKIDFCCGGDRPLGEAITELGLNSEQILSELDRAHSEAQQLRQPDKDWRSAPLSELVDYIINSHHAYLNSTLPELGQLTSTVLRAHGANHKELVQVHRLFNSLKMELEQHLISEETQIFPLVKEFERTGDRKTLEEAVATIDQLESEHLGAGDILKELRQITDDYAVPADGCGTYERTYRLLQELEADLFRHIHLENNILHIRLRGLSEQA